MVIWVLDSLNSCKMILSHYSITRVTLSIPARRFQSLKLFVLIKTNSHWNITIENDNLITLLQRLATFIHIIKMFWLKIYYYLFEDIYNIQKYMKCACLVKWLVFLWIDHEWRNKACKFLVGHTQLTLLCINILVTSWQN